MLDTTILPVDNKRFYSIIAYNVNGERTVCKWMIDLVCYIVKKYKYNILKTEFISFSSNTYLNILFWKDSIQVWA